MMRDNVQPQAQQLPKYLTHGIHSGIVGWTSFEEVQEPMPPPGLGAMIKKVTLVHFQGGSTLKIDGTYNLRIGARYEFRLINGTLVSALIITKS